FVQSDHSGIKASDLEAHRKSSAYDADFKFYLDRMDEFVTATTLPFPDSLESVSQWDSHVSQGKAKGHLLSGILLPSLALSLDRAAEGVGRSRVAQTALALERYRLAHSNALPDSLGQLIPQFIEAVPTDPFDGRPLRYQKLSPQGYLVYSIGKDRTDDGGQPRPTGPKVKVPADITFAVRR